MTLTVHLGSFIVGVFIGLLLSISAVYFGEEWHVGFSNGWECGAEYQKKKEEKETFISQADYDDVLNATAAEYKHLKILHDLKKLKEREEEEG